MNVLRRLMAKAAFVLPGGDSIRPMLHRWRGVKVGRNVWIAPHVYLDELYPDAITIGDNCTIGLRTSMFAHFHWGGRRSTDGPKPVVIEDDVFVGPHCVILPGVRIGEGAVIKAGSVVSRNVPPRTFWGDAGSGPLALLTVPLTPDYSYEEFMRGMRPLPRNRADSAQRRG
jgi:acetyltransferase-like isoleucine patch superfamily enzyme